MLPAIRISASTDIDPEKWDNCIAKNTNGLFYAKHHYLSQLSNNWSAIIIGDYEALLPLPWNSKWGIKYYEAIPFIQQLGLIGTIDTSQISIILDLIVGFAKYGDLFFNFSNQELANSVATVAKMNLVLDLNQDYESIAQHYKKDLLHNLERAQKHHPIYLVSHNIAKNVTAYQKQYNIRFNWITKRDFEQITHVLTSYQSKGQCIVRELIDQTTDELLASAILLKDEKRLYLLINTITDLGRKQSSNHLLIDRIINEFANTNLIFDFEGSEIPGVQEFFKNFHPSTQPYFHFHHNQLRWPLNLLKP
jgi:hypothetical protein